MHDKSLVMPEKNAFLQINYISNSVKTILVSMKTILPMCKLKKHLFNHKLGVGHESARFTATRR